MVDTLMGSDTLLAVLRTRRALSRADVTRQALSMRIHTVTH